MQAAETINVFFMGFLLLDFHTISLEQEEFEVPKEYRNKLKLYECQSWLCTTI